MSQRPFFCVIPAGGSGTRLWPLSRAGNPKFLHALTGTSASLLQATVGRLAPLAAAERVLVVTGAAHAAAVARQLPDLPEVNVLVEPAQRDSCAAIGLAAAVIARRSPDAIMGSFAADHLVARPEIFVEAIRAAIAGADQGALMTVGITPTHAETGYGYLECGPALAPTAPNVRSVTRFKEKPSRSVAEQYLASGAYLWNASMFVWRVDVFLAELSRQRPLLHEGLCQIAEAWGGPRQDEILGQVWPRLEKISVDHAVMEGAADAGMVATVPGDFGWTDVGDFDTLGTVFAGQVFDPGVESGASSDNVIVGDVGAARLALRDTTDCIVVAHADRLVALLGVKDLIVVDTPDALLVCARDRAQEIKSIVDDLKARGEGRYL